MRRGQLNLTADSRLDGPARVLPAVGWIHDFQSVSGVLNLPPGWKLLAAGGVDVLPDTWFEKWTLLDIFLVLIIALAVSPTLGPAGRVAGARRGGPQLPRTRCAATRLAPPPGRDGPPAVPSRREGETAVRLWWLGAAGALFIITIPFVVQQARWGIYPQLESKRGQSSSFTFGAAGKPLTAPGVAPAPQMRKEEAAVTRSMPYNAPKSAFSSALDEAKVQENRNRLAQDPKARIQTGPGLPEWQWRSVTMKWNGPVDRSQQIDLWLISPACNFFLGFLRIILLVLFIYSLLGRRPASVTNKLPSVGILVLGALLAASPVPTAAADYPSRELLGQLEERLLEKPDCLPNCAESARMEVNAGRDTLRILVEMNAAVETLVPLPGNSNTWFPEQVLLDEQPAEGLRRAADGTLWMVLPEGIHRVTEIGRLPAGGSVQIPLGLKPHFGRFQSDADWEAQGIQADGRVEPGIQLTKRSAGGTTAGSVVENAIEPFVHVERLLEFGLDSHVKTTVRRLTPPGTPIMLSIPLLDGESVVTAGIQVTGGQALVHMGAGETMVVWEASLDMKEGSILKLAAPDSTSWTETWTLDASPVWHCRISGIPVIHHKDQEGYWRPQWRPWAGERIEIAVTKPVGIPGQSVTIDQARLLWTPGERFNKAELAIRVRSSQGGQHKIILPEGAELDAVRVMGKTQPIPASNGEQREIAVPLQPGTQDIAVEWRHGTSSLLMLKGPAVEIGQGAVNAAVTFNMPSRWILWTGGPQLGPRRPFLELSACRDACGFCAGPNSPAAAMPIENVRLVSSGPWIDPSRSHCISCDRRLASRARMAQDPSRSPRLVYLRCGANFSGGAHGRCPRRSLPRRSRRPSGNSANADFREQFLQFQTQLGAGQDRLLDASALGAFSSHVRVSRVHAPVGALARSGAAQVVPLGVAVHERGRVLAQKATPERSGIRTVEKRMKTRMERCRIMNFRIDDLRESNEFLNTVIENINTAIFIVDETIRIRQFNNVLSRLFRKSEENMLGEICGNALGCAFAVEEGTPCGSTSECGKCKIRRSILDAFPHKAGKYRERIAREFYIGGIPVLKHLEFSTKLIHFDGRDMILVIVDDMTESELKKQELIEKQRRIDEDLKAAAGIQQSLLPHTLAGYAEPGNRLAIHPLRNDRRRHLQRIRTRRGVHRRLYARCQRPWSFGRAGCGFHFPVPAAFHARDRLGPALGDLQGVGWRISLRSFRHLLHDDIFSAELQKRRSPLTPTPGHPPMVLLRADATMELLDKGGTIIGLGTEEEFEEAHVVLQPGTGSFCTPTASSSIETRRGSFSVRIASTDFCATQGTIAWRTSFPR